jgi:hypothetical protein
MVKKLMWILNQKRRLKPEFPREKATLEDSD